MGKKWEKMRKFEINNKSFDKTEKFGSHKMGIHDDAKHNKCVSQRNLTPFFLIFNLYIFQAWK